MKLTITDLQAMVTASQQEFDLAVVFTAEYGSQPPATKTYMVDWGCHMLPRLFALYVPPSGVRCCSL